MKLLLGEPYTSIRTVLETVPVRALPSEPRRSKRLDGSLGDVQAPGHSLRINCNEIIHFPSSPDTHDHGVSA